MIGTAHNRPSAGSTPGITRPAKTPYSSAEEIDFSGATAAQPFSGLLAGPTPVSPVLAPDRRKADRRPDRVPATRAQTVATADKGGADPNVASQVQPRRAGLCRGSVIYTNDLSPDTSGEARRCAVHSAGSTLAEPHFGLKNGVHLRLLPAASDLFIEQIDQRSAYGG